MVVVEGPLPRFHLNINNDGPFHSLNAEYNSFVLPPCPGEAAVQTGTKDLKNKESFSPLFSSRTSR